ncbi:hypothetical protein G4B88_012861 [Cannabis sativa]|uniref:Uncharacterized protein n=1 Tax=Cannabis sativa TaxID=3483 RepID=A0A7J6DMF2_CANSA|nr:hypothetical protein G4B88_012861 [Cannabis sativa]
MIALPLPSCGSRAPLTLSTPLMLPSPITIGTPMEAPIYFSFSNLNMMHLLVLLWGVSIVDGGGNINCEGDDNGGGKVEMVLLGGGGCHGATQVRKQLHASRTKSEPVEGFVEGFNFRTATLLRRYLEASSNDPSYSSTRLPWI